MITAIGRGVSGLEKNKSHSCLQGGPKELQASHPHLNTWEDDGVTNRKNHFQAHEGQGDN